jgi:hypothetical protein
MQAVRRRITYANVVSTMALVLALGGGVVYAAAKIGPHQISKNAIRSYHIHNKQVKRQDIAGGSINSAKVSNDTLTGKDIGEDSLTGRDIQESSLGLVPSAQDARTVNGVTARVVRLSQPDPSALGQVAVQGGLTLSMSCGGGDATMQVRGTAPGDAGTIFDTGAGTQRFDFASTQSVFTGGGAATGFATVLRTDGTITRFDYELVRDDNGFGGSNDCFLHGFLLSGR